MTELKTVTCDMDEQETTITFSRKEDKAYVYTSDNTMVTKIAKLLNAPDSLWTLENVIRDKDGNPTGYEFSVPKKMVALRSKPKVTKELTDEERQALRNRLRGLTGASDAAEEDDED